MDVNVAALIAGIAALGGVIGHGVVGGAWLAAQLRAAPMPVTELSKRLFGDRNIASMVFHVTWHAVTAFFLLSGSALLLTAFGALSSPDLLRFTAAVFAAFAVIGLTYVEKTREAMLQPIPLVFAVAMTSAAALAWVASDSL